MPIFEFKCGKCDEKYETLAVYDETEKYKSVKCPHCSSKKKTKLMSCSNFAFTNPEGTARWNNTSTGHDYRFKHNTPKVKAERKMAEALSKTGPNPYDNDMEVADINMDTGIHDAETRSGLT